MMFAVAAVPLIAATGAAIDYSRAYEQRLVVQDALDAAALAANKLIGMATNDEIFAEALAFFNANTQGRLDEEVTLTMVVDGGSVRLSTNLPVPTSFLGIIGIQNITFDIRSVSIAGAATYEVVMVLDNSTSMRGSKLTALKSAATDLVNSLFALSVSNPADDPIRIGLVPFAASVNVGASNATATWMDTGGIGPTAGNNFAADGTVPFTNRFDVFEMMDVAWRGCVEARPYPYDVTDATPTTATPATLFQPMFAPDEPDYGGTIDRDYQHDYLDDAGEDGDGVCEVNPEQTSGGYWSCDHLSGFARLICQITGQGRVWVPGTVIPAGADYCDPNSTLYERCLQQRVCKYQGVDSRYFDGLGEGPNLNCTANALTPMSTSQSALLAAITAMNAPQSPIGYTNIEEGIAWGWRVLSENEPFTQGRPYDEAGNHKILIVMTDGANTYVDQNTINKSQYMAFNYIYHGYLDVAQTNPTSNNMVDAMNDRTIEVCENIQNTTNITVYTIAFQIPANETSALQIMAACASDPSKAFDAGDNNELITAFRLIAQDIATLRIAE